MPLHSWTSLFSDAKHNSYFVTAVLSCEGGVSRLSMDTFQEVSKAQRVIVSHFLVPQITWLLDSCFVARSKECYNDPEKYGLPCLNISFIT